MYIYGKDNPNHILGLTVVDCVPAEMGRSDLLPVGDSTVYGQCLGKRKVCQPGKGAVLAVRM
eukprot:6106381-Prorocentrum_lima.AAC.1